ncbi:hypothetical protein F4861DRAFT_523492 [Xylaria intraflava]|nr:hypothetical protein F4861DRAFT_523492 [Xylaria intraflava]
MGPLLSLAAGSILSPAILCVGQLLDVWNRIADLSAPNRYFPDSSAGLVALRSDRGGGTHVDASSAPGIVGMPGRPHRRLAFRQLSEMRRRMARACVAIPAEPRLRWATTNAPRKPNLLSRPDLLSFRAMNIGCPFFFFLPFAVVMHRLGIHFRCELLSFLLFDGIVDLVCLSGW